MSDKAKDWETFLATLPPHLVPLIKAAAKLDGYGLGMRQALLLLEPMDLLMQLEPPFKDLNREFLALVEPPPDYMNTANTRPATPPEPGGDETTPRLGDLRVQRGIRQLNAEEMKALIERPEDLVIKSVPDSQGDRKFEGWFTLLGPLLPEPQDTKDAPP